MESTIVEIIQGYTTYDSQVEWHLSTIVEIIQGYTTPNSPFLPNLRLNDGIFSLFFVYYIQSFWVTFYEFNIKTEVCIN